MISLPPNITKVHFPTYTMARTKLVVKPTPSKSPSMLELYAHCVCATAMENEEKMKYALDRAAQLAGHIDGPDDIEGSGPRNKIFAEGDPRKPINGGFVYICMFGDLRLI